MKTLSFSDNTIEIDGRQFELDHVIKDARIIDSLAIVIYKFDQSIDKRGQFRNCVAFDKDGRQVWTAEHPTNESVDFYLSFMEKYDIRLWNFACYVCKLDFKTGKLLNAQWTK